MLKGHNFFEALESYIFPQDYRFINNSISPVACSSQLFLGSTKVQIAWGASSHL